MVGERLDKVFRIEAHHIVSHDRTAHPGGDKGVEKRVDMAARHDKQVRIVEIELVVKDHNKILGKKRCVGFYDTLRFSRCSAGIHNNPGIGIGYDCCGLFRACLCKGIFIGDESIVVGGYRWQS
ncbi:MAG: hypothetical protein A4E63_01787 [Syntrophorhabdus sp. PtaU1.Bin050]|nr:MAG: hypothetical protein A4E63_01787 [Syntrophorhabdus sp. PtaU1.Bin050]